MTKTLHNEWESFYGYFTVNMTAEDPESIILSVRHIARGTRTYFKYGSQPSNFDYEFSID